jgi:hypothetical protein
MRSTQTSGRSRRRFRSCSGQPSRAHQRHAGTASYAGRGGRVGLEQTRAAAMRSRSMSTVKPMPMMMATPIAGPSFGAKAPGALFCGSVTRPCCPSRRAVPMLRSLVRDISHSHARLCAAIALSPRSWRVRTCATYGDDGRGGGRGVNCCASPLSACINAFSYNRQVALQAQTHAQLSEIADKRGTHYLFGRLYPRVRSATGTLVACSTGSSLGLARCIILSMYSKQSA